MPRIKMTYAHPEQLRAVVDRGTRVVERIPDHPKRPAHEYEVNTWWETISAEQADEAIWQDCIVRHFGD